MELGSGSLDSSTIDQKTNQIHDKMMGIASYEYEGCDETSSGELELGLGLSIGVMGCGKNHNFINNNGNNKQIPRIFTAKDLPCSREVVVSPPSSASSCSSLVLKSSIKKVTESKVSNNSNVTAGVKRAASPTAVSQVVGWPPIRSYRMNSMANQAKSIATGERNSEFGESKEKNGTYGAEDKVNASSKDRLPRKSSLFVKVNMDGIAIGRKVDLTAHSGYEALARTLEDMFTNDAAEKSDVEELNLMPKSTRPSKLLDGKSDFVLTYEDKDGDWMLVGDVPWRMFVTSVKRLKIMRRCEANGLSSPRSEDSSSKQKRRPILAI